MWDFFETVRHRHSVRLYQQDMPVDEARLHAILEMACAAPSAGDLQAYRIVVVRDADERRALSVAADNQGFIAEAPVCLVFCADPVRSGAEFGERGERLYALQDTTIAAAYAQLAIVAAGMGSAWIGYFDDQAVRDLLGLDPALQPVALMTVGYPAELPVPTPRRRLAEVVSFR